MKHAFALFAAGAGAVAFLAVSPMAEADELIIYNWANYFPPALLERFEAETGIAITLDIYDSNETLLARLEEEDAGYDVVVPSDYMVRIMIERGLAERIDVGEMPNFANVLPPHESMQHDPERAYSAPYLWGTTGFTYDSSRVGDLPESWGVFFEPPEALRGEIAVLNDEIEVYNAAAYFIGVWKCTEKSAEADRILEVLRRQQPHVALYDSDGTIDRVVSGDVIMHHQWNGAAHRSRVQRPSLVYVYPEEGTTYWADNFVVPRGARNIDNARIFINWMMDPENIAIASNFTGYMNGIRGAEEYMEEHLVDDPAVFMPEDFIARLRPAEECSPEADNLRNSVWMRLRS
jgi:spermidine/putrescine transport system substrate-binding protein